MVLAIPNEPQLLFMFCFHLRWIFESHSGIFWKIFWILEKTKKQIHSKDLRSRQAVLLKGQRTDYQHILSLEPKGESCRTGEGLESAFRLKR